MENKTLLHIVLEIVIFTLLIYYFMKQNRILKNKCDDLYQKLEEQEIIINKHTDIINKILNNSQPRPQPRPQPNPQSEVDQQLVRIHKQPLSKSPIKLRSKRSQNSQPNTPVKKDEPITIVEEYDTYPPIIKTTVANISCLVIWHIRIINGKRNA